MKPVIDERCCHVVDRLAAGEAAPAPHEKWLAWQASNDKNTALNGFQP
jgi:hypothetical protein